MPPSPSRRLRFTLVVLISQLLLIALSLAWVIHMAIIALYGRVYFVEDNPVILWLEIITTFLIFIFGISVFVAQLRRLGERRRNDGGTRDDRK
jgi:hypothetical protein